jgi:hypothetical protein
MVLSCVQVGYAYVCVSMCRCIVVCKAHSSCTSALSLGHGHRLLPRCWLFVTILQRRCQGGWNCRLLVHPTCHRCCKAWLRPPQLLPNHVMRVTMLHNAPSSHTRLAWTVVVGFMIQLYNVFVVMSCYVTLVLLPAATRPSACRQCPVADGAGLYTACLLSDSALTAGMWL